MKGIKPHAEKISSPQQPDHNRQNSIQEPYVFRTDGWDRYFERRMYRSEIHCLL